MANDRRYSLYDATVDDWSSILALAHRWSFPQVKSLVIRELEKLWMPDIDRIVLYHKYNIDRRLLISSYAALCEREKFVTLDEGLLLGMETVLRLSRARECARNSSGSRSPSRAGLDSTEMHDIVKEHFGIGGGTENQNGNHDNQASTGSSDSITTDGGSQSNGAAAGGDGTDGDSGGNDPAVNGGTPAAGATNGKPNGKSEGEPNGTTTGGGGE